MVVDEGSCENQGRWGLEVRGTPGQRSSSIERARGPARWRSGGRAREDEVVGSTGFDLVVGKEGREEATMDREEKVVGSVCKSRRWVDRLDGWIEGMAGYEMDLGRSRGGRGVGSWLAATGGMGQLSSNLGLGHYL